MKITLPLIILLAFLLAGCSGQALPASPAVPAIDATQVFHNALLTATFAMVPQASDTPL
jgi:PBP1b-binding outer membrane lipoprotein LpoB